MSVAAVLAKVAGRPQVRSSDRRSTECVPAERGKRGELWSDCEEGSRPHDLAGRQQICSSGRTMN